MTALLATMAALLPAALAADAPTRDTWSSLAPSEPRMESNEPWTAPNEPWIAPNEPFDAVLGASRRLNRTRRQINEGLGLAVPAGAILSIAPRFGWLLYQGENEEEELDLVFQSEFLYHFPHEEEDVEHHERLGRQAGDRYIIDPDTRFLLHRNKRMVRDKKMVYTSLQNVFSIVGLDGRACVLRAICEVTATPLAYDGIVGELLNMALVPRHTNGHHEDLKPYVEAEEHGRQESDCSAVYPACPISMFHQVEPGSVDFE